MHVRPRLYLCLICLPREEFQYNLAEKRAYIDQ